MAFHVQRLLFALAWVGSSTRVTTGGSQELASSQEVFECPPECEQCCKAAWAFNTMNSGSTFKCILKQGADPPATDGRKCGEVKERNSDKGSRKVECDFTLSEHQNDAWQLLGRCISSFKFPCPDECQECCQAGTMLNTMTSSSSFKCILRKHYGETGLALPPGRKCTEPELRSSSSNQAKTGCEFWPSEKQSKASEALAPCSTESRCCCDVDWHWSEKICLPLDRTNKHEVHHSYASGEEETYEALKTEYANTRDKCMRTDLKRVEYEQYHDDPRLKRSTTEGCCLQTKNTSVRHDWVEKEIYTCTKSKGSNHEEYETTCEREVKKHIYHWVNKCNSWERLFYCAGKSLVHDESKELDPVSGIKKTGNLYMRVSTKKGTCFTNAPYRAQGDVRLTLTGDCPAGFLPTITNKRCECEDACAR